MIRRVSNIPAGARTALVTGAAGFVGRHMVAELAGAGWHVDTVDLANGGDALDVFRASSQQYDLIVHAAAVVGGRTMIDGAPFELAAIDLELDAALWRFAHRTRPGRVVYLSSSAAYPVTLQRANAGGIRLAETMFGADDPVLLAPDATYGFVKLVGERMALAARADGLAVTIVRPFSGYGTDQALDYPFPSFIARAARRDDPFDVWGTGEQVRDFIHITDVVRLILELAAAGIDGPVNLGTGRATSFLELARLVTTAAGYSPTIRTVPDAPAGVDYRVADTRRLEQLVDVAAVPLITLEAGIDAALFAATDLEALR